MKRMIKMLAVIGLAVLGTLPLGAQGNPRGNASLSLNGKAVSVEYGRPSLKGRSVDALLGKLKPGGVWRLGADKSTTFMTETDLSFGSVTVPKGTYSLWARHDADGWKLVFNKQHGQWGTEHDAAQDLAAVPLKESKASKPAEQVTINLSKAGAGGEVTIEWGDMKLAGDFTAK